MQTYLNITEILISIVLIVAIIAQARGSSGLAGSSQDQTTVFRTRRGVEKTLFQFTLVLAAVFILVSIANGLIAARV